MKRNRRKRIMLVSGARPNFMKIAPIISQLRRHKEIEPVLVHTGQHYDKCMSKVFFNDLNISEPDVNLNVGSGSHANQTAEIMKRFEKYLIDNMADMVLVVGDINSTLACSLVAAKLNIKIAHVEAGLRSFDRTMPEEVNRILTDAISDILFTTCDDANNNLIREGIDRRNIYFVGNVMIDSLLAAKQLIANMSLGAFRPKTSEYAVLTLHRPGNIDDKAVFRGILKAINKVAKKIPVIFPCHPRTIKRLKEFGLGKGSDRLEIIEPLGYLKFLKLMSKAMFVLTDSGGIQEETTVLDIPCLTLRDNTERPITVRYGTNTLVGTDPGNIIRESDKILGGSRKKAGAIPYWDGNAAKRITNILAEKLR